jgi:hypothetical protein
MGGDPGEIKKESYLDKFVHSQESENYFKKQKSLKYALKPTSISKENSVLKIKIKRFKESLKKFQRFKNIRVHLEKIRLLCSQLVKREKLKNKLEIINGEIISQQIQDVSNNILPPLFEQKEDTDMIPELHPEIKPAKRKRGRPPLYKKEEEFEPPVHKSLKNNDGKKISVNDGQIPSSKMDIDDEGYELMIPHKLEFDDMIITKEEEGMEEESPSRVSKRKEGKKSKNKSEKSNNTTINNHYNNNTTASAKSSTNDKYAAKQSNNNGSGKKKDNNNGTMKYSNPIPGLSISRENPNEPNDHFDDAKPFKLKRELQKIMSGQNLSELVMFNNFCNAGRVTRTAVCKNKLRNSKNYHYHKSSM